MSDEPKFNPYEAERDRHRACNDFEASLFDVMDHVLGGDALFCHLNQIIDACAQEVWQMFHEQFQKPQRNELLREVFFYCCIFSLKLGLLIALRQGADSGSAFNENGSDYDV